MGKYFSEPTEPFHTNTPLVFTQYFYGSYSFLPELNNTSPMFTLNFNDKVLINLKNTLSQL